MESKRHQRLRSATGLASALWAAGREDFDGDQQPARPGDVFVAATGGDLMIEWLVVDTDAAAKRLRIAPADDDGHAGSLDVELDRARHGGLACVRRALACWVGDPAFDPRRRTGRLDRATLLRVRRRLANGDRGQVIRPAFAPACDRRRPRLPAPDGADRRPARRRLWRRPRSDLIEPDIIPAGLGASASRRLFDHEAGSAGVSPAFRP